MKDLFYSPEEKTAFYVAGYTDNSHLVENIVTMLTEHTKKFSAKVGVDPKAVKTDFITSSRRYKHMRVFYAGNITTPPADAFVITAENGWTMDKWLRD